MRRSALAGVAGVWEQPETSELATLLPALSTCGSVRSLCPSTVHAPCKREASEQRGPYLRYGDIVRSFRYPQGRWKLSLGRGRSSLQPPYRNEAWSCDSPDRDRGR